jgi:DNA invertase Pin-like site-specific DNA recombinase
MRCGTSTEGRTGLRTLIEFARAGDMIVVTRIDRLARSAADLAATVRELELWSQTASGRTALSEPQQT